VRRYRANPLDGGVTTVVKVVDSSPASPKVNGSVCRVPLPSRNATDHPDGARSTTTLAVNIPLEPVLKIVSDSDSNDTPTGPRVFRENGAIARSSNSGSGSLEPTWTISWFSRWANATTRSLDGSRPGSMVNVALKTAVFPAPDSEITSLKSARVTCVCSGRRGSTSSSMRTMWKSSSSRTSVIEYMVTVAATAPVAGSNESISIRIGDGSKLRLRMISMYCNPSAS